MTWSARRVGFIVLPLLLAMLLAMTLPGQRFRFQQEEEEGPRPVFPSQAEFHFVRVEYTDLPHIIASLDSRRAAPGAKAGGWWTGRMPTTTFPKVSNG